MEINSPKFKIIVKTRALKNEILDFDKEKQAYKVCIKAIPSKGNANKEIIKFLSKQLKKKVKIVSGLRSKEKIIETYL
jgi:uncharacterized protein